MHKKLTVFLTLIVLFLFVAPLLLNLAFTIEAPFSLLAVNWTVDNAISYFQAVLGVIVTIFLGYVALKQTTVKVSIMNHT